ncbi:MAG: hypothetical protein ACRD4Q_07850 [Candidatus Acidiferrales bacterium]
MKCPQCKNEHAKTRVIDSQVIEYVVMRRRECPACGSRFVTQEKISNQKYPCRHLRQRGG